MVGLKNMRVFIDMMYEISPFTGNSVSTNSRRYDDICKTGIYVPDHVVTLAQDGTSPNMGWPNKELTTLSLLRPKIP